MARFAHQPGRAEHRHVEKTVFGRGEEPREGLHAGVAHRDRDDDGDHEPDEHDTRDDGHRVEQDL